MRSCREYVKVDSFSSRGRCEKGGGGLGPWDLPRLRPSRPSLPPLARRPCRPCPHYRAASLAKRTMPCRSPPVPPGPRRAPALPPLRPAGPGPGLALGGGRPVTCRRQGLEDGRRRSGRERGEERSADETSSSDHGVTAREARDICACEVACVCFEASKSLSRQDTPTPAAPGRPIGSFLCSK